MYQRFPQESPQFTILDLQSGVLIAGQTKHIGTCAEKRLQGFEIAQRRSYKVLVTIGFACSRYCEQ
jgi:hypothetical protein